MNNAQLPRKQSRSLRELTHQIPDPQDLFQREISEEVVIGAVERWLNKKIGPVFRYSICRVCADLFASRGHPQIAAKIMEMAGEYIVREKGHSFANEHWKEGFDIAADYWLSAGNFEERQNALLMSAAITMKSSRQQPLFADPHDTENYSPLWKLALDYFECEQHVEAASTYQHLYQEMLDRHQPLEATRATLLAGNSYRCLQMWPDVLRHALEAIVTLETIDKDADYLFRAHFMAGTAYLRLQTGAKFEEGIRSLETAKDYFESAENLNENFHDILFNWLGEAYSAYGRKFLTEWELSQQDVSLRLAVENLCKSVEYFESMFKLPIADLGANCGLLSLVYRKLGDNPKADAYASKAMAYGFQDEDF